MENENTIFFKVEKEKKANDYKSWILHKNVV